MNDDILSPVPNSAEILLRSSQARLNEGAKLFSEVALPSDARNVVLTLIFTALEAVESCIDATD